MSTKKGFWELLPQGGKIGEKIYTYVRAKPQGKLLNLMK